MASIYKDENGEYRFIKTFGSKGNLFVFADERIAVPAHVNTMVNYSGISRANSSVDKVEMAERVFNKGEYIPPYYWYFAKGFKTATVNVSKWMNLDGSPNCPEAEKFAMVMYEKMRKG